MNWRLDIVCTKCDMPQFSQPLVPGTPLDFTIPNLCPTCIALSAKGKPPGRGASRFTIWRETRKARRFLQRFHPEVFEP